MSRIAAGGSLDGHWLGYAKPFAVVIVGGLISRLFIVFFVNPVLYELVAKEGDVLQV